MMQMAGGYAFGLLGSLEVVCDGQTMAIPGQRQRALLAILLLDANRVVPTARIIQGLWGAQPPKTARESVHFFVHKLRDALPRLPGQGAHGVLETHGSGYLLRVDPARIDLIRFQRLVGQAAAARTQADLPAAWARFGEALELWRGRSLADFAEEPFAQPAVGRLEEQRLVAVEGRLEVGLGLGRHGELVGELEALVRVHPDRARLWQLLMLALYRSGRQADALAAYQAARSQLTGRRGVEHGGRLQELQRAILTQDSKLDLVPRTRASPFSWDTADRPNPAPGRTPAPVPATPTVSPPGAEPERPREERKLVTALVVGSADGDLQDVAGSDPEDLETRTQQVMASVAARVRQYGGAVQAVAMGRLLAVFGAKRSRDDDPERAVRAALEVTSAAAGTIEVRIGVATGEAVVAVHAGDQEDDQRVLVTGDVLNAAFGLAASAEAGTIMVGEGTHRATRRAITYRRAPAPAVLGGLAGVGGWQALAPRARTGAGLADTTGGPLVERERELRMLADVLQRLLRDQEPQLLTIVSAPGLGKSRLVAELGRMVHQAPELITWRTGRSLPSGVGSLWALAEIVRAHAGIQDTDPAGLAADKLSQAVGQAILDPHEAASVTERLEVLLGSADQAGDPAVRSDPALMDGWIRFFGAGAAVRPMVIVVEDLHWADAALLEFLDELVERVGPVPLLVVCTARLELLEQRPRWGGGKRNAATITLSPLSRAGTTRLLNTLLDMDKVQLPDTTRQALLVASGGNPLYVEEYARMLNEGHADPAALADPGHPQPVPETIQQLIATRLDTLDPAGKRLLQDAAVIGEVGWAGALAAVSGQPRGQVEAGMRRLERQEFLRRVRGSSVAGETEYTFRHGLIRDVAYSQLLRPERATKHEQVAAWLQHLTADPRKQTELAAYHYSQAYTIAKAAGQPTAALAERARHTLRAAADHAAALGAFAAAAGSYTQALELSPRDDPDRAELLFKLGEARSYGEHAGEDILVQARDALQAVGRLDRAQEADVLLALAARSRNDGVAAHQHLERALARPTGPSPARAMALAASAVDLMIQDRHHAAITAGQEALRMSQALGAPYAQGLALEAVGGARLKHGDPGGQADLERCIGLLEQQHNPAVHYCRFDLSWGLWWLGDLTGSAKATATGRHAAEEVRDAAVRWFDAVQAGLDYVSGRWEAVLAAAERFLGGERGPQDGYLEPWYQILRARIRLARGTELVSALTDAGAALEAATAGHDTRYRHVAMALQGRVLLAAGEPERAGACLDELAAEQAVEPERACATPDLAVLLVDLDRSADQIPDGLAPTRWHEAVRAFAARDFARAAELYAVLGSPVDQRLAGERAAG